MGHDLRTFRDTESLSRALAEAFVQQTREIAGRGSPVSVVLAGGGTPRLLYQLLGQEFRDQVPWSRIHFFWSDERFVPLDHPDSNYRMVREALFDRVAPPAENVHVAPTDLDQPEEAARRYEKVLQDILGSREPRLDCVLLGLGEDGHLASLFPGAAALAETTRWVVVVNDSPKPPPLRLTLTLPLINRATRIHFLVAGAEKAEALRATLEGPFEPARFPAQGVRPIMGSVTWWVDEQAARTLKTSS